MPNKARPPPAILTTAWRALLSSSERERAARGVTEAASQAGKAAVHQVIGRTPRAFCWAFGTHAAHLVTRCGLPTIGLGPGREEDAHTPGDHVPLTALADAVLIYAALAADLLSTA